MLKHVRAGGKAWSSGVDLARGITGVKLYPVAIPGATGGMVNLENLVERMTQETKMKAIRMAMSELFPPDDLQNCVITRKNKKADARMFDQEKLDALFEVYREFARRSGLFGRLPDRRDFGQMCSKVRYQFYYLKRRHRT